MTEHSKVPLGELCELLRLDPELAREFAEFGLFPVETADGQLFVQTTSVGRVWQVASLHRALGINKEGIDVVLELRQQIDGLEEAIALLEHQLSSLRLAFNHGLVEIGVDDEQQ